MDLKHTREWSAVFEGSAAAEYDALAPVVVGDYLELHRMVRECVRAIVSGRPKTSDVCIFDLGAGTGVDISGLMQNHPNCQYVAIDKSEGMLERARRRIERESWASSVSLVKADFLTLTSTDMLSLCSRISEHTIHIVICVMALHHYSISQKQEVYRTAKRLVGDAGAFINVDIFRLEDCELNRFAKKQELAEMKDRFAKVIGGANGREKERLRSRSREWLHHYRVLNKPLVMGVDVELMRGAGFARIDCVYRYRQNGLLIGRASG